MSIFGLKIYHVLLLYTQRIVEGWENIFEGSLDKLDLYLHGKHIKLRKYLETHNSNVFITYYDLRRTDAYIDWAFQQYYSQDLED